MENISTDRAIECILYAVAEKQKIGLDMQDSVERAKGEIFNLWSRDMSEMKEIEESLLN